MKRCCCGARGWGWWVLLVVLTAAGIFWDARPTLAISIFINEIHYDNMGADTNEGVEISGLAGTDLTGWALRFYNGNGGSIYGSMALEGVLSNQVNGFGFLFFDVALFSSIASIQNGAPDGIALVDDNKKVVQFLSYEGVFTATAGDAINMESKDIGIAESDDKTESDWSLQLSGAGSCYEDFTWIAAANTFGSVNKDQIFVAPVPEPGSFLLLGLGIAGMVVFKKRSGLKK